MWLIDQLAERHIQAALNKGSFPGLAAKVNHFSLMMTARFLRNYVPLTGY